MYGRVTPLPAAHPKARGFTQRWMGLYGFMLAFLLVEAVFLMVEKYNVSDDVLQGNYVLLDQGDDAAAPLEYIYQYPPLSNLDAAVGVLFLAHGCSHAATDFWSQYERTCPQCHGLPVEKAIVGACAPPPSLYTHTHTHTHTHTNLLLIPPSQSKPSHVTT